MHLQVIMQYSHTFLFKINTFINKQYIEGYLWAIYSIYFQLDLGSERTNEHFVLLLQ